LDPKNIKNEDTDLSWSKKYWSNLFFGTSWFYQLINYC